jgi:diguanylate cyclase (GGDEF)-like protein
LISFSVCRLLAQRYLLLFATLTLALGTAAHANPAQKLVLTDAVSAIEVWPSVSFIADPARNFTLKEVLNRDAEFAPPNSAYAGLGLRKDVVWLKVPIDVRTQPRRVTEGPTAEPMGNESAWVLDIDYALLNRVDVYLVEGAQLVQRAVLGDSQPLTSRPLRSRSHAVELELKPGQQYALYLRIETRGSMILPISLFRPSDFHHRAINEQMLQGMLAALGLCLLLYSLMQWVSLREHLYLKYAVLVSASSLFCMHFFGIGELYFWTDNFWIQKHMAGLTSLSAAASTALFIEDVLGADLSRRLRQALKILGGLLATAALLHALDLIDIQVVSVIMGTLGLMPVLLGLPGAIARVRRGDMVGTYFMLAWIGYFVASAIMAGVVNGYIGVHYWSLHAFQYGATFDMMVFMRIAVLRTTAVHLAAQRASMERDTLLSLAHTDPLTGLMNRRGLNTRLAAALPTSGADKILGIYMLDLDGFKPVNDQHGHDVGDELLVIVAKRLRATVRTGDVVARLGGDEFVIMASGLHSRSEAEDLGHKLLGAFRTPFKLSQQTCSVGATIGFALAPLDGNDVADLLKRADAAMYAGKQDGKNCIRHCEDDASLVA